MDFEFATSKRILFGSGVLARVPKTAAAMGRKALVVTGVSPGRHLPFLNQLQAAGIECTVFKVEGEPTTSIILAGINRARQSACDMVVGIGGGSVIDTGKAVAVMLTNKGQLLDYLEVVGKGLQLANPSAPYIAIPSTAGTGAEVTRNAVIESTEHKVKVSMRSPHMLPALAVVDPALTHTMPPQVTASTGLDALTQLMEAFVTHQANPLTDGICREGISRAARSLQRAFEQGADTSAREDMAIASLFGGLALANAKLGAVHGFAGPVGGMYHAPHGLICARLTPLVMEANVNAIKTRQPRSASLLRYHELARILTGNSQAEARHGVEWLKDLCLILNVPSLGQVGLKASDIPEIVAKSAAASSMKGNPVELTASELTAILEQAL